MYIQIRDKSGVERFIEEMTLEAGISSGEVVAIRRSEGWIDVNPELLRGMSSPRRNDYRGQERRRSLLGRRSATAPPPTPADPPCDPEG